MSKKDNKNKKNENNMEKYGEFIPTLYTWTGLEKQKKIAKKLENITNKPDK